MRDDVDALACEREDVIDGGGDVHHRHALEAPGHLGGRHAAAAAQVRDPHVSALRGEEAGQRWFERGMREGGTTRAVAVDHQHRLRPAPRTHRVAAVSREADRHRHPADLLDLDRVQLRRRQSRQHAG